MVYSIKRVREKEKKQQNNDNEPCVIDWLNIINKHEIFRYLITVLYTVKLQKFHNFTLKVVFIIIKFHENWISPTLTTMTFSQDQNNEDKQNNGQLLSSHFFLL